MDLVNLTSNLGLLGFALASVLYLVAVQKGGRRWATPLAFALFVTGTGFTVVALVSMFPDEQLTAMSGLLLAAVIGLLATFAHLLFNLRLIGAFVAPLATFILLMQFFLVPRRISPDALVASPLLLEAHITFAIIGEAFAVIACAISVLYLWQQNLLKKKLLDQIPKNVPAIDRLDTLLVVSVWAGFVFLTLGLLSGALFVQVFEMPESGLWTKVLWAILVWVWYLAILLARNVFNRPSKRIAQMCLVGLLFMAMTYFGIGFFRGNP